MYQYPVTAESGLEISSAGPAISPPTDNPNRLGVTDVADGTKFLRDDFTWSAPTIKIHPPEIKVDWGEPPQAWKDIKLDFSKINENLQNWKEPEPPKDMGLGKLGSSEIVFVRQFRWTLESDTLEKHYAKKVEFDFHEQRVLLELLEAACYGDDSMHVHDWIESLKHDHNQSVKFTTLDGCGNPIYRYTMTGLGIWEDKASFDYASTEVASRKLLLHYRSLKREYLLKRKND